MSAESYSGEKSRSLSVEIPGSSSVNSSLVSSPTGILSTSTSISASTSTSTSTTASTSSLPDRPSISFAPLPELAPRRRRSTAPLGMAARSQLMRRRRHLQNSFENEGGNAMWTDEEMEQQRQVAMNEARRRHYQHHYYDEDEDMEGEDPFLALGKLVKGAGKSIWRRVSQRDLAKKGKAKEKEKGVEGEVESSPGGGEGDENRSGRGTEVEAESTSAVSESEQQRHVLATITPNEGDAAEIDADDDEHFRLVGQTETIRDGHAKYAWITEALNDTASPRPSQSDYSHEHS
ncbi:hypothetical protein D9615_001541 [Tricholomella constricta]|uniref:Uncharacterized protein n=1 Tax=Tricholomella constricta TaxID=117010 RepID=A0A8H5MAB9_9AGAR|nr:hypothetical protein D9615_001541 [Tricholomella constricta]